MHKRIEELRSKSPRTPQEQAELRALLDKAQWEQRNDMPAQPKTGILDEPEPDIVAEAAERLSKAERRAKAADAELGNG